MVSSPETSFGFIATTISTEYKDGVFPAINPRAFARDEVSHAVIRTVSVFISPRFIKFEWIICRGFPARGN